MAAEEGERAGKKKGRVRERRGSKKGKEREWRKSRSGEEEEKEENVGEMQGRRKEEGEGTRGGKGEEEKECWRCRLKERKGEGGRIIQEISTEPPLGNGVVQIEVVAF